MDYTVHGILKARLLEQVDFPFSRASSQPRDWTQVSRIAGGCFTSWATSEAHICISIWYLRFSFWLTSLCIIRSSFIHLIRTDLNAFLFMAEKYSIVYMNHNFFIHSPVSGHLGCFHVLAIKIVLQWTLGYMRLFQFWFPRGICLGVGLLGHMVAFSLVF